MQAVGHVEHETEVAPSDEPPLTLSVLERVQLRRMLHRRGLIAVAMALADMEREIVDS